LEVGLKNNIFLDTPLLPCDFDRSKRVAFWAAPLVRADVPNIKEPVNAVCSGMAILRRIWLQRGWGRLGRFRGAGRVCDQLGAWFCGLGYGTAKSGGAISGAARWAERIIEEIDRRQVHQTKQANSTEFAPQADSEDQA
jgi:hypothetical protein